MKLREASLSHEALTRLLDYDPATGVFRWKASRGRIKAGAEAGFLDNGGYVRIRFQYRLYMAHRLAWFFVHREYPTNDIDHIDNDRTNNRINNLRHATRAQNCQNQKIRTNNTTGFKGVYAHSSGGFVAQIVTDRKHTYLGIFDTAEEAYAAYVKASLQQHQGFGRTF